MIAARPKRTACAWPPRGTHPFADWREQDIYPDERYQQLVEDLKMVARANLIFGLHVHVGIEDREDCHPAHECGALFPAAHAGALHQLAVLARAWTPG